MRVRLNSPVQRFFLLFAFLLALRVPFYFTHHVQEDAYISLRCAENLVETGVYGFNPGEKVSSSTSHLYVLVAALVRLVVGHSAFIPAMLLLNTIFFLLGTFLIARVLLEGEKEQLLLWALTSSLPVALLISYSGMETSLLVMLMGLTLYFFQKKQHPRLAWLVLALLPWIRPDAIAIGLLVVFWSSVRERRLDWQSLGAVLVGGATLLVFNLLYFGSVLHQSIAAKLLMRHDFSWSRLQQNIGIVFIGQSDGGMFSPIRTRFLGGFGVFFLIIILTAIALYLWHHRNQSEALISGLAVSSLVFVIPLAYAFGGVLYQWYFWPSALLGYTLLLAVLVKKFETAKYSKVFRLSLIVCLTLGAFAQWVFSYSWGMKEFAYRGGIGVWLQEHARSGDRVLLEPAGYIPYYSDLYTFDEVGLVSPQVVTYRQAYELRWWPEFVMDYQPEWIVQRGQILSDTTYQGYKFNEDERAWFHDNYQLKASFTFDPQEYSEVPFLERLLQLGQADDYYVFQRAQQ